MLESQQKTTETDEKVFMIKNDLALALNSSIGIVDLSFNILMGLGEKRIDWDRLESYTESLEKTWNFKGQIITPLTLDFAGVSAAVKKQVPKATSKETFNILKAIYSYFDGSKPDENQKDANVEFQKAKTIVLAYYTLNDLMFAKVIGEGVAETESSALETALQGLANEPDLKVNFEELMTCVAKLSPGVENKAIVEDTRILLKGQLKLL